MHDNVKESIALLEYYDTEDHTADDEYYDTENPAADDEFYYVEAV